MAIKTVRKSKFSLSICQSNQLCIPLKLAWNYQQIPKHVCAKRNFVLLFRPHVTQYVYRVFVVKWIRIVFIVLLLCLQCRRWICGDNVNESGTPSHWPCLLDAAGDFQIVLWNWCSIFSIWPANMLHEIRLLDVRRRSGRLNRDRYIFNFCSKTWHNRNSI